MYRAMSRAEQDSPNDQLFDLVTKKVVEFMHQKDISEWDNNLWGAYRAMLAQHTKQPLMQNPAGTEEMEEMTEEQLTALTALTNLGATSNS